MQLEENFSIFKVNEKNLFETIQSKSAIKNYDFVIIGTVHRYFNTFYKITENFKTSIIIHNRNFTEISTFNLFLNIFKKESIFRLKLLVNEGLLLKNKIINSAKNLYIFDENLIKENSKYSLLPLLFSTENIQKSNNHSSIVIPGNVSQQRRNYKKILKNLEDWCSKNLNNNENSIEIVFLGKADKNELLWLQNFEKNQFSNLNIIYFKEKVPQDIFDEYMKNASFLWCPLQMKTEFFSVTEIYGRTKISGIIGDAMKYQKIAYLPKSYTTDFPFLQEDFDDFQEMLNHFESLNYQIDFQEYSLENVSKSLDKILKNI